MTSLTGIARRLTSAAGFATGLVLLGAAPTVAAQDVGADARWQAWLGCWEAVESDSMPAITMKKPRICVIPAAGTSAVDVVTLVGDSVAIRQHIEVTGAQREMSRDGCTGWERATWSENGQRVYLRSSYSCPGGLTRSSNGIMAMSAAGKWLDVQGVVAGTTVGVRVVLYRDVTGAGSLPPEIAAALEGRTSRLNLDARIAAMAPLTTEDVVEASRFLDPGVIQTWLAERGEGFALDAKRLIELEEAGVAPNVIDVMVALTYPNVFALDRSRVGGPNDTRRTDEMAGSGRTVYLYGWDPFYSNYGYGYGYGSRYGYDYGGWYYGNRPVIVVRQPSSGGSAEDRHGRVVKGRGYTPGPGAGRRGGAAAGSKGESGSSGGSASTSSGSGSSSKEPSAGSGRTAKPRPPK